MRLVGTGAAVGVGVCVAEAGDPGDVSAGLGVSADVAPSSPAAAVQPLRPSTAEAPRNVMAARLLGVEKGVAE
ncbi:hypothetical protein [Paenarthrobacter ilicis]|uniref:hypothetical protein n=1 Tax=Paenarthrobacter ilicis TaxID=43665 RepID=UPI0028D0473E|nr:hypothetical protein [Paenarthrobacter ilicis]